MTVHDLAFAHSPELCRPETMAYEPLLRQAIERGALVHTVSDFVAAEVRDDFDLPAERVARIYAGIAATGGGDASAGQALADGSTYVLAMGTIEPRKNLPVLVRGVRRRWPRPTTTLLLVVVGPDGWGTQAFDDAVAHARFGDRVRRLGYVTDANAPTSSRAHRCWRTPRSTRASVTPRSRPWPRACPS